MGDPEESGGPRRGEEREGCKLPGGGPPPERPSLSDSFSDSPSIAPSLPESSAPSPPKPPPAAAPSSSPQGPGSPVPPAPDETDAAFFRKVRWVKILIWALFLGLVYVLRSFFAVIFLTFIISYIAHNVVDTITGRLGGRRSMRKVAVILTFAVFVFLVYSCGRFIVPNIYNQARGAYRALAALSLDKEKSIDRIILKAYGGIRFLLFEATDAYEKEFAAYKEKRLAENARSGWEDFKREAAAIRKAFREEQVGVRGAAAYWKKRGSGEYREAFRKEVKEIVTKEVYLPDRENLDRAKEEELIRSLGVNGYGKLKDQMEDWPGYLENLVVDDLVKKMEDSPETKRKYEDLFREKLIRREGEAAVAELEGTAEWEDLFEAYYEKLSPEERSFPYGKFKELEKARSQKEYEAILGGAALPEEKLAADFRKEKEKEYAAGLQQYEFLANIDEATAGEILPGAARLLAAAIEYTFTFGFTLLLSVFFGFIIVWDIPKLGRTVRRLENSRVSDFYREIAPGLVSFGNLMGRAFQAQAVIAVINTLLTLTALSVFGVQNRAFLCTIVFLCSFIPVVGVVLSSVPIALMALQQPGGGIGLALIMIAAVIVIHFIETTILNPKVMGDMLKLHPLLVLIILVVGEHFFGVWGLLLGVPVCVYIFRYVILKKDGAPPEDSLAANLAEGEKA